MKKRKEINFGSIYLNEEHSSMDLLADKNKKVLTNLSQISFGSVSIKDKYGKKKAHYETLLIRNYWLYRDKIWLRVELLGTNSYILTHN